MAEVEVRGVRFHLQRLGLQRLDRTATGASLDNLYADGRPGEVPLGAYRCMLSALPS